MSNLINHTENSDLLSDISLLIEQSKRQIASQANSTLTLLFWQIGKRINDEILLHKQAEYGKQILSTLSTKLKSQYGRNFEERNLRRMIQFSEIFSDYSIVVPLARQLSWSHFVELLPIKTSDARLYYAQLTTSGSLGISDLRKQITSKAFERSEIANIQLSTSQPELLNVFKGPYLLDFLNLKNLVAW